MIELSDVIKKYGQKTAVNRVTLSVEDHSLFGLIGPDGAGKTTLFRLISSLLIPDSGSISVFGLDTVMDYKKIRMFTGYMPGRFSLYPDLTVIENLQFYATIFGTTVEENYHLIQPVYSFLEPFSKRLARNLSGGMKQKLALSCALIHNPRLLILDEPTTGVDAVSRKEFWETLHELKRSGMTIIVSTPYMDEAEKCDRVALIQNGTIFRNDTPVNLIAAYNHSLLEIRTGDRLNVLKALRSMTEIRNAYLFGHTIHITVINMPDPESAIRSKLADSGFSEISIHRIKPDFEDCFIDAVEQNKEIQ